MKESVGNQHWLGRVISCLLLFWGLQLLAACAGDAPNSSMIPDGKKSSASLTIRWHARALGEEGGDHDSQKALNCQSTGIEQVVCEVYAPDGNWLLTAGPWPCTAGRASVDDIPAGPGRIFVVTAEDSDGNIFYHGVTTGVLIEPGLITEGVVVDAYRFVPRLVSPLQDARLDPAGFNFEWEALQNADQYLLEVSGDQSFDAPFIDHTTRGNTYAPSDLQPSTQYFWRVRAYDRFTNPGVAADFRRFVTTDCTYAISSGSNAFGSEAGSGGFEVTALDDDCQWIAVSGVDWVRITEGAEGSGNGQVSYEVAANPASAERTGTITAGGEIHTITQEGVDCTYQLTLSEGEFPESGGSATIQVTASAADCSWEAVSDAAWITITAGAGGQGNGAVALTVAPNTTAAQRTGHIAIAEDTFTITQEGGWCTYQTTLNQTNFTQIGGSGTVQISASAEQCPWEADTNVDWITFSGATSGEGNATTTITVAPNPTTFLRTGRITIAGETYAITQEGMVCTYQTTPSQTEFTETGGSGTIQVTSSIADCPWNAVSNVGWITFSGSTNGQGNATVTFTVAPNPTTTSRTGRITIADATHTITQTGMICTYQTTPSRTEFPETGGSGTIQVTSSIADCPWNAVSNVGWITFSGSTNGQGNATVTFTVAPNPTTTSRNGRITIAEATYTITQAEMSPCTIEIAPANREFEESGGPGTIVVTTSRSGCPWNARSNVGWIRINSGASGTENGTVRYTVSANATQEERTGVITVAGQSHTVHQEFTPVDPEPCNINISPPNRNFDPEGGPGTIDVTTSRSGCPWNAESNVGWIRINSGASGTENGTVRYTVSANATQEERTGVITVAGRTHTVHQEFTPVEPCTINIRPSERNFGPDGGSGTIDVTTSRTDCTWNVRSNVDWITIISAAGGTGNGRVDYEVSANDTHEVLTGGITVANSEHTVRCRPDTEDPPDNDQDGYTESAGDCDDNDAAVNPGAAEVCRDQIDNNCNGEIDERCGEAPVISNLHYDYLGPTDRCFLSPEGEPFEGELFALIFDYDDADGDSALNVNNGAHVFVPYDNTTWSTFTGNGFTGTIRARVCFAAENRTSNSYTVTLRDADLNVSNRLPITVYVPEEG